MEIEAPDFAPGAPRRPPHGTAAPANPDGPTVVHGSTHFARPGANALDVTTSPNAIIHWRGFSIGAGETTRFLQPSASSAVLNRVTGADPSAILGRLLSNGRVFLVNPHGIVFGEGDAGLFGEAGAVRLEDSAPAFVTGDPCNVSPAVEIGEDGMIDGGLPVPDDEDSLSCRIM